MSDVNETGRIFIREGTALPAMLCLESEPFLPGWRVVNNPDRQGLTREVERASWNFFYLAGETRATVFGRKGRGALRRAVKCVLAKQEGSRFNSLEVTEIASKWFLGIPFMRVTAHSRHIQQGIGLVAAKDFAPRVPARLPEEVVTSRHLPLLQVAKQFVGDEK